MTATAPSPCSRRKYDTFAEDVLAGLCAPQKSLPIKWTYNSEGSRLFSQITELQEYYLCRTELENLRRHTDTIATFAAPDKAFSAIIELGCGDGRKAEVLVGAFTRRLGRIDYSGVDISMAALEATIARLRERYGRLVSPTPFDGEFVSGLQTAMNYFGKDPGKVLLTFLGSSIGNFPWGEAVDLLRRLNKQLRRGDQLLIGFDLKKDPRVLQAAYDDPYGVTAKFNLNLLQRINDDLGGDFDLAKWQHHAIYDPHCGAMLSFMLSVIPQTVTIAALEQAFIFRAFEPIYTECSGKYAMAEIEALAAETGFGIIRHFFEDDREPWFCDSLWQVP